jgi:hypothetical protein
LLCSACNRAIGWLRDDPEVMEKAAAYVRSHRPTPKENVIPFQAEASDVATHE